MTETKAENGVSRDVRWLDRKENVASVYRGVWVVCALLLLIEPLVHKHAEFTVDALFGRGEGLFDEHAENTGFGGLEGFDLAHGRSIPSGSRSGLRLSARDLGPLFRIFLTGSGRESRVLF